MRLSEFILQNLKVIVQQCEDCAGLPKTGGATSIEALRDDAEQMLRFVAAEIESTPTRNQEAAKASGRGPALPPGKLSAAHEHGISRAADRMPLIKLMSDYRALRGSVTRMWIETVPSAHDTIAQIVRFNEAIDQVLSEGVAKCAERMDRDADLFTASVAHDLANPLQAVTASARLLGASHELSMNELAAVRRITRATSRISGMLDDLRDYTRTRLGGLVRIDGEPCDVGSLVREIVDELAVIYPKRHVVTECSGDLTAHVDERRISQLVSNLIANSLQHGTDTPRVDVYGDSDTVTIDVHNTGPAIDPERLRALWKPLSRLPAHKDRARLGLGLYIAHWIALAHNGTINVASTDTAGTRFRVRLPRRDVTAA